MQEIINITGIPTTDYMSSALEPITNVRFITRCRAGFMTISEARQFDLPRYNQNKESLINGYKKGALQTVEVEFGNSGVYLTVFARVGKKIKLIDKTILADLTVGTINSMYYNTNLYSAAQYAAVNSKTWASKAFTYNTEPAAATAA